jgi:hypothetical protein
MLSPNIPEKGYKQHCLMRAGAAMAAPTLCFLLNRYIPGVYSLLYVEIEIRISLKEPLKEHELRGKKLLENISNDKAK